MSGTLINAAQAAFTETVITKFASLLGEQESNTYKAIQAAIPMVVTCMLHKVGFQQDAIKIYDLSKHAAGNDFFGHLHELSINQGGLTAGSALLTKGSEYARSILTSRTDTVIKEISRYAGIGVSSASFIIDVACFATLDAIGRQIANASLDTNGMIAWLATQRNSTINAIPAGLQVKEALGISRYPGEKASAGRNTPLYIVLALIAIAIILFVGYRSCNNRSENTSTTTNDTVVKAVAPAQPDTATAVLPNGQAIIITKGGTEEKLVGFLSDPNAKIEKKNGNWFNFTRISFDRNSANLLLESDTQLKNIVAILNAFPKAEIKISGYTDNVGDSAVNQRLSQQRAENVQAKLKDLGANPKQLKGAKGYGPAFPIGDNGTEEGRAMNRRIAINVIAK